MLPPAGWETAMMFLVGTVGGWWGGSSIAYLFASLFGYCAVSDTVAHGLHGDTGYVWLLTMALLVSGYLRDHPESR